MPAPRIRTPSQVLYELLAAGRIQEARELLDGVTRGRRLADTLVGLLEPVLYRIGADVALDVVGPEVEVAAVGFVRATLDRLGARGPWKTQTGRRALAAVLPGEEHDLGLQMLVTLLVREGWSVARVTEPDVGALAERVAAAGPELVCLSVTCTSGLPLVTEAIAAVHARAAGTHVMVGGLAFRLVPERAVRVGADLFAEDARAALEAVRGTYG